MRVHMHAGAMSFGCATGVARWRVIEMLATNAACLDDTISIYVSYSCGKPCDNAASTMQSLEGLWLKAKCLSIQISTSMPSSS